MANTKITSANLDTNIAIAGTLGVTGNITGTLATAAQTNITSVGTLTSFRSTGIDDNADALAITIDSSERVGIGMTPSDHSGYMLQITGGSQSFIAIGNDTTGTGALNGLILGNDSTGADIYQRENQPLRLHTNNTERMRVSSNGDIRINTTGQMGNATLTVKAYTNTNTGLMLQEYDTSNAYGLYTVTTDDSFRITRFVSGSYTDRLIIDSSGNCGIGGSPTNYSDHKTLSLYGNTGTGAGFIEFNDTSGNADAVIFSDDGNLFINADYDNTTADSSIRFRVDGSSEKMRISSGGAIQHSAAAGVSAMISRTTAPTGSQGLNITASVVTGLPVTTPTFADNSSSGASIYLGGNAVDQYGGSVILKAYGAGADGNLIVFENRSGTNTFAERMRITSDGSIGFGTNNPSSFGGKNFEFSDTSTAQTGVRITCSAGSGEIGLDNTGVYIQSVTVGDGVTLYSSNSGAADTIALKIFSTGEARHFSHTANTLVLNTSSNAAGTNNLIRAYSDSSNTVDGNVRFVVFPSGNVQNSNNSYGQISDRSLKENIVDTTSKLDKIKQVRIRNFNFIGDDLKQIGVVAQELETVFPNLVETIDDQDMGLKKSVKYSVFVPILIKAIQEQQTIIDDLKTRIETLEG